MNFGILDNSIIFFSFLGYDLSYVEFIGTILYFTSVILIARKNIFTWPAGIASVILYAILFYQVQLYADLFEQLYYLIVCIYGWLFWNKTKKESNKDFKFSSFATLIMEIVVIGILSSILYIFVFNLHLWYPSVFMRPASYPFLDSTTTSISFVAMYLVTIKRVEGWIYWIIVDAIGIFLYWQKGLEFISIQYCLLFLIAGYGFIVWLKKNQK
ncbi:nicotinamide riboside transporter PnuC [Leptospira stimsonii]|uniref:Nicotinamide riboside transporter PnuC n=1 Tax=Leptospira stimsonii TaxID=2202203 RepID=A0ABY2N9G5_9LEPT|nr:nicotinamide riboside transporter PnuC [Leptospira stimsonii]TGK19026.1 nicotinamide riboside transporter PnuC [Leptospira stimsonii]TGM18955.1 nicotinamide riboside transporter PnuC [Leptospira stimsonii]